MQRAHTDNTQLSDRGVCSSQRSRRKTGEASRRRRAPACPGPSEQPQRSSSGRALVTSKRAARRSGAWTSETQARPGENPPGPVRGHRPHPVHARPQGHPGARGRPRSALVSSGGLCPWPARPGGLPPSTTSSGAQDFSVCACFGGTHMFGSQCQSRKLERERRGNPKRPGERT